MEICRHMNTKAQRRTNPHRQAERERGRERERDRDKEIEIDRSGIKGKENCQATTYKEKMTKIDMYIYIYIEREMERQRHRQCIGVSCVLRFY